MGLGLGPAGRLLQCMHIAPVPRPLSPEYQNKEPSMAPDISVDAKRRNGELVGSGERMRAGTPDTAQARAPTVALGLSSRRGEIRQREAVGNPPAPPTQCGNVGVGGILVEAF